MSSGAAARVAKISFKPVQASTSGAKLLPGHTYYASVKVFDGREWSKWATTRFSLDGSAWVSAVSNNLGWTIEARVRLSPVAATTTTTTTTTTDQVVSQTAATPPAGTAPQACESDAFQGIRFYDGTRFGYLRIHPAKAELLASEVLEFELDGTEFHTYRVTARGADVKLYVDGALAIDGAGKYSQPTTSRAIEFGDISGRSQTHESQWASFRYSVDGVFPPNQPGEYVLSEIIRFPGNSIGRTLAYKDHVYVSVDPADPDKSSSIFRFSEGFLPEQRSVLAITRSSVTAVVIDPNRDGNVFGTSGKYIGTDRGLQYVLGGKPFPFITTSMDSPPDETGWFLDENCSSSCASISNDTLTIDTLGETGEKYHKYVQASQEDDWVKTADNDVGWTVEVRVRVEDDGNGNAVTASFASGRIGDDNCPRPPGSPEDDSLEALGVLVNDGAYEETVQFFQTGIRLRKARIFGSANLKVFNTVRIIGKGRAIAVYAKADGDKFFKRVIQAPDAFSFPAQRKGDQEKPCAAVDSFGFRHVAWQDSRDGKFAILHARTTGKVLVEGQNLTSPLRLPAENMIASRVGFGLPPAGDFDPATLDPRALISGSSSFVTAGVKPGDVLFVRGSEISRQYVVAAVPDEVILILDTAEDLSNVFLNAEFVVVSGGQSWGPPRLVSAESLDSTNPRMIAHSDGDVYVVYQNISGGNSDIYMRHGKNTAHGVVWLKTVRITNSSANSAFPDVAEMANGDFLVAWQSDTPGKSQILFLVIEHATFGDVPAPGSRILASAEKARRPRIATGKGGSHRIVVVFESDDSEGVSKVVAAHGGSDTGTVVFSGTVDITQGSGPAKKPVVASNAAGTFFSCWEDQSGDKPALALSTLSDFDDMTWITAPYSDSRGACRNPELAINSLDLPLVAFDDDRLRDGFPELYVATESFIEMPPGLSFDPTTRIISGVPTAEGVYDLSFVAVNSAGSGTGSLVLTVVDDPSATVSFGPVPLTTPAETPVFANPATATAVVGSPFDLEIEVVTPDDKPLLSTSVGRFRHTASAGSGLDVKLETYLTTSSRPSVALGPDGDAFIVWEGQDSFGSRVYGAAYDGFSTDTNENIAGYFPMNEYEPDGARMINKFLSFDASGRITEPEFIEAVGEPPPVTDAPAGRSVFGPGSDKAIDIDADGQALRINTGIINKSGAIDLWLTPHWTTDTLVADQHVFFGNASLASTSANTMSCGVDLAGATKSLIFRVIDGEGRVHESRVVNDTGNPDPIRFSWEPGDNVHLRAIWNNEAIGASTLNSVSFPSSTVGFACGGGGHVFKTTDGGTTWSEQVTGVTFDLFSIDFVDVSNGVACGEAGLVLSTTDGGATWQAVDTGVTTDLHGIFARTTSAWYAAGDESIIIKTTNSGATWTIVTIPVSVNFSDISLAYSAGTQPIIAVGDGFIFKSADDGGTFEEVEWLDGESEETLNAISKDHAGVPFTTYIAGTGGIVLSSSAASLGADWEDKSTGRSANLLGVAHDTGAGSDRVYVVGALGFLATSSDAGDAWDVRQTGVTSGAIRGVASKASDSAVAVGIGGSVLVTSDSGVLQYYAVARGGAVTIMVNGKEPTQARTGDVPFDWEPSGNDFLYIGDHAETGTTSANAVFDELVIYKRPPPADAAYGARQLAAKQPEVLPIQGASSEKRIEWGGISPLVKTKSHWKAFKMFLCGAREPLYILAWNAQLGLVDDVVRDLAYDETSGRLWAATENGISGLDLNAANADIDRFLAGQTSVSNASDRFVNYTNIANGLLQDSINTIAVDHLGNIWAGSDKGIMFLEKPEASADAAENDQAAPRFLALGTSSRVLVIRIIGQNAFVGTDAGLVVMPLDTFTGGTGSPQEFTTEHGLPSNRVQSVAQDNDGAIWVGTDKGAAKFFSDHSVRFDAAAGLPNSNIHSITVDGSNRKYLGTGAGIVVIDGNQTTVYPPSSGIGVGAIRAGAADSVGHVWFATASGLSELNFDCGSAAFLIYGVADGIIGETCAEDFRMYWILGGDIPKGGCNKALVRVSVNGEELGTGFDVVENGPFLVFDQARTPSDDVEVCLEKGWRRAYDFGLDSKNAASVASVKTGLSTFFVYRKRFAAGTVSLGGNLAKGSVGDSVAMYFVVVEKPEIGQAVVSVPVPAGVVVGSATEGASAYSDAEDKVVLFPNFMRGHEMIRPPSGGASDQSDVYMEVELAVESTMYVAYDSTSAGIPNWLRDFKRVPATFRVTDMTTFEDASGDEKLFASVAGTNGCVYEILNDPSICDISASIALDSLPPDGCATISRINSLTDVTLALTATDSVSGVSDMQISARADFTTDGTTPVEFVPFQRTYNLSYPASSATVEEFVSDIPEGDGVAMIEHDGAIMIGTSSPGHVYRLDRSTSSISLEFDTGEDAVESMAVFGQYLAVGTSPNGKCFIWDGESLQQLSLSLGEQVTAMAAFDSRLFLGTAPDGKIYEVDEFLNVTLFMDTHETSVTGFAIFGGRLFWTTMNEFVDEGDEVSTTTAKGHKHSFVVPSGAARLSEANGATSEANGHSHAVVGGVVQEASGHSHALNASNSGKIFRHDISLGHTTIVHSDRDYWMTSIASTSLGAEGVMFAGSYPNGKILRFVQQESTFIKSFDTLSDRISRLKVLNQKVYAIAENDVFFFDGSRWQFVGAVDADIVDVLASGNDLLVLKKDKVSLTSGLAATSSEALAGRELCAYVKFRDVAGNTTRLRAADGTLVECFSPCAEFVPPTTDGGTTTALPQVHRIVEIDEDAEVVFTLNGAEVFYSGNRVEKEIGVYESEVFNGTTSLVQWVSLSWEGVSSPGASITIAVRTADSASEIVSAEWGEEFTNPNENDISNLAKQFLQFRATLTVDEVGQPSPELHRVDIQLRTSQATHYFTTNFKLPDDLLRGILTYNGCVNPPVTDVVFGISGKDSTDFADYLVISPNKVFELPSEHQDKNLRVGIKLISSTQEVPIVDEFALLVSLANDAVIKFNLAGTPSSTGQISSGPLRTVLTDQVQGHAHTVTFDSQITEKSAVNGQTSINSGHSHVIIDGQIQSAAGHTHDWDL
jgi:photosystem II stability/assembly factor-like uncharacterized protein